MVTISSWVDCRDLLLMLRPQKLDPASSMYLRGFDRRGCSAALHDTSDNGFTISGLASDIADFAVLVLADMDDLYGHLTTTKYLPDSTLHGLQLDFDYFPSGLMPLESYKYASVAWNQLSYITASGSPGAGYVQPLLTAASGMLAATGQWTVTGASGSLVAGDTASLWYLNLNFTYTHPNNPAGSSVVQGNITYFAAGAGAVHSFTTNYNLATSGYYTYTEQAGDGSYDVAVGVAAAVNGVAHTGSSTNGPDPFIRAAAVFAIPNFTFFPKVDTGALVECTDNSDFSVYTILETLGTVNHGIANNIAAQANGSAWATSIRPTTAMMASVVGDSVLVQAARYGVALFASGNVGTVVAPATFAALSPSGCQNFLGSQPGDLCIVGGNFPTSITSIPSPNTVVLGPAPGATGTIYLSGLFPYLCPGGGADGNSLELYELHANSRLYLSPTGSHKLVGGQAASGVHCHIDFTTLGIDNLRQAWLTLAPAMQYNSAQGVTGTLVPFHQAQFAAQYENWAVTDPYGVRSLRVAGSGSQIVDSRDSWAKYSGTGWTSEVGFYRHGFAAGSSSTGDYVSVFYSCGYTHDLYVGTSLYSDRGIFQVSLDGVGKPNLDCYLNVASQLNTRRLVASGVASGQHTLVLKINSISNPLSSGTACYFDYLHAVAHPGPWVAPSGLSPSGVAPTGMLYPTFSAACDYDTDQTYKLSPQRLLNVLHYLGFGGDIDFYAGVFFALIRKRYGGNFHAATVAFGGTYANGDQIFLDIGGTTIGKTVTALDTLSTIAAHFMSFINATFVGVWAIANGPVLTITTLSPINGFTLSKSTTSSAGTVTLVGDIGAGNEGVWQVDASQVQPLNRAFVDYLSDWCRLVAASGLTTTVSFSQELLAPPDVNTVSGAWSQRFYDGTQVLTDTGFGSWGAGVVEAVAAGVYLQMGHGYVTGNTAHFTSSGGLTGSWALVVTDQNHYQLGRQLTGGAYIPGVGDTVYIDLQTTQCNFSPLTVTPYITNCHKQAAQIQASGGLIPWEQDGEVGWWFFSESSVAVSGVGPASPSGCLITTYGPHPFTTGDTGLVVGVLGSAGNGTGLVTVIGGNQFVMPIGFSGAYTGGGTAYGGSMAYYDAYTSAAAASALGRALVKFTCQDADPSVNSYADANFLRAQVSAFIHAVNSGVKASVSGTHFEGLFPLDVNNPCVVWNPGYPFAQGGRLNNYVNSASGYLSATGQSDVDRLKMEGLSWGASYRDQGRAQATIEYPYTTLNWPKSKVFYLIPWFNGGCAWGNEYLFWLTQQLLGFNFWALDHAVLLSWDVPLPLPVKRAFNTGKRGG